MMTIFYIEFILFHSGEMISGVFIAKRREDVIAHLYNKYADRIYWDGGYKLRTIGSATKKHTVIREVCINFKEG